MDYVVEKKISLIEIIITGITLYMMIKELVEAIQRIAYLITEVASAIAGGFTGTIAGAILLAAKTLINIAYAIILGIAVVNLGLQLIETLVSRKRTHRVMTLRRGMEIVASHLGLNLVSTITELDDLVFLPSNPRQDDVSLSTGLLTQLKGTPSGIPNIVDFGYNCLDFFSEIKRTVLGKFAVIGNNLHFESLNSPFWINTSTYVMESVLLEEQKFNTDEMRSNFAFSFSIDPRDDWTIDNSKGFGVERITDAIQTINLEAKDLTGLDKIKINWALATRKNELTGIEKILLSLAKIIDEVAGVLNQNTNLASKITSKVGALKVSDNSHTLPKLIYLGGGTNMPSNHRDLFSADVMEAKYYNHTSFVQNNFGAQKLLYNSVRVPFGLKEFNQLINNSFFTDSLNRSGQIINIDWTLSQDFAVLDFWIKEKYAPNLTETFIRQL